ncbi:MAG TPA: hypothetical protein VGC42_03970 [Kofleriaceae bacterium]
MSACKPDLPHTTGAPVAYAVFNPTTGEIPLPNDLAFGVDKNSTCNPVGTAGAAAACAQAELLQAFGGAFPSDQEVAVTIDFVQVTYDDKGAVVPSAPDLDLTSFTASTFGVVGVTAGGSGAAPIDPLTDADYVKAADGSKGTLTIHHQGHTPWPSGNYALYVRGGDNGVKTKDGLAIGPSDVFDLIAQGQDMEDPKNLGLLKAQYGTTAAALAQGKQLNLVIGIYKQNLFPVVDLVFPHQELAVATTFRIDAQYTNVAIDPGRGLAPLPFDLLRDPVKGTLTWLAACTFAGSTLGADGQSCASAQATGLASGFVTLDGFSTTGAILGPTSDLIAAQTVTSSTLMLYDLSDPAHPALVPADDLIIEPCEFTNAKTATGCTPGASLSPVIAFQPAGASAAQAAPSANPLPGNFRSKPLKDATDYAVVMTTGIKDKAGKDLASGTVAKILKFTNVLYKDGKSQLSAIDDATAAGLEKMRGQLVPVFNTLAAGGITKDQVAIAYTFHTQTVIAPALKLAALPYTQAAATGLTGALSSMTADAAFTKYGADALTGTAPDVNEVIETSITTFNLLDPATGAFHADPSLAVGETIQVLIATPKDSAAVPACTGSLAAFGKCAPVVVFRHGLTRGRADMLALMEANAKAGMATIAIDAAKHGDRAFCEGGVTGTTVDAAGAHGGCYPGVVCNAIAGTATQGDVHPPGTCATGGLFKVGVTGGNRTPTQDGIPAISGTYLVSANFFRTRDTMRQDLIDESQLIRAVAYIPAKAPPTGHSLFDHLAATGLILDPAAVYYTGQSLGSIQGVANVATDSRISKAVFNVGGGTVVDVFTNSPAFAAGVDALLAGLGISKTDTAKYLQFLVVAKTVLDPADPINFADKLINHPLPNLLADQTGATAQTAKKILTQIADCDNTVPNPFNVLFTTNIGGAAMSPAVPGFFTGGGSSFFQLYAADTSITTLPGFLTQNCATSSAAVSHGFLLDFKNVSLTTKAQGSEASFLRTNAPQLSLETP